jgi:hypothetical protein
MQLIFMTAVQDYTVHRGAKLTRVCHCLNAQVPSSSTYSEPHTHTHARTRTRTHARAHTHTHTHTHYISPRSPEYYLPVCVKIFHISNYSPVLECFVFFYLGIIKTLLFRSQLCFDPQMANCRVDPLRRAPVSHWAQ